MQPKSAHQKGDRYEIHLVEIFRSELDIKAHRTPGSGSGLDKNDIRLPGFDVEIEAKNANTIHLIADWEQLQRQLTGDNMGALAIRNPKKREFDETLMVISLADFIELVKSQKEDTVVLEAKDPKLKYSIGRLDQACKDVLREMRKSEERENQNTP